MLNEAQDPLGQSSRLKILEAAKDEIHKVGFQSASIRNILKTTGLSKGAFYHYFKSKNDLGCTLINELLLQEMKDNWVTPLQQYDDPAEGLILHLGIMCSQISEEMLICGCPLNNLANEMSTIDEDFRVSLEKVFEIWISEFTKIYALAQKNKIISNAIPARSIATFIVSFLAGVIGLTKNAQSPHIITDSTLGLVYFLKTLKI